MTNTQHVSVPFTFDARHLTKESCILEIDVTGLWRWRACLWIAKGLILLGGWIAGLGVEFEGD